MNRRLILVSGLVIVIGLIIGGYPVAQDQGEGKPVSVQAGTPGSSLCATPVAELEGTAGAKPGTPATMKPCPSPSGATPVVGTPQSGGSEPTGDLFEVEFQLVDFAFVPAEASISANTDEVFRFVNMGSAPHNFIIDDPEVYSGDLGPGETSEIVVNLPPATYEFHCTIPGHREAGMVGTLTVE